MAQETEQQQETTESTGGNGQSNGGHKTAVRAAAIAAATGATAFAAKKALSGRDQSEGGERTSQRRSGGEDESMVGAMFTSGWHAAKDSLLPFAEDAAGAAGEWVGREGPELLSETLVPRFIRGFEKARRKSGSDSADESE
jgi:hypothetical protein